MPAVRGSGRLWNWELPTSIDVLDDDCDPA
jgi:hypothetical protein